MSHATATRPLKNVNDGPLDLVRRYDAKRSRHLGRIEGFAAAVVILVAAPVVVDALKPAQAEPVVVPTVSIGKMASASVEVQP